MADNEPDKRLTKVESPALQKIAISYTTSKKSSTAGEKALADIAALLILSRPIIRQRILGRDMIPDKA